MWFKILFTNQHYPLAAMVGEDDQKCVVVYKSYPVMTQKSKLETPDVMFNILNAELSSLHTSFATSLNAGEALVEDPGNLFVESYKLSPVLHVHDSPVPRANLVRKWVQDLIEMVQDIRRMQSKTSLVARVPVERLPAKRPSERHAEPLMDFLVNEVDVTSRIPTPLLITL
ncbi:uncharacterized protein TNCV_4895211 [Trichonephila clavipes]|nr:uncharacterized protein TNCV_4895211 [Trichonephila clavipes]